MPNLSRSQSDPVLPHNTKIISVSITTTNDVATQTENSNLNKRMQTVVQLDTDLKITMIVANNNVADKLTKIES